MKLVSVTKNEPDGTHNPSATLLFQEGERRVSKKVFLSDEQFLCARAGRKSEALYTVARKVREAEHDFSYMIHGKDWRDHVSWGVWNYKFTDEERKIIDNAAEMIGG